MLQRKVFLVAMKRNIIIPLLILMLILLGCGNRKVENEIGNLGAFIDSENSQREKDGYLSYEHYYYVDISFLPTLAK